MGPDKSSSLLGDGSFLTGAIFMSNRTTKKECFSRKLFGLPSFQANFVKKIKAGMILFLFEYEERKLYGVFQATSDGAMNIIPTAFISSGRLFSAQVCFRTVWCCRPLTEPEFQDAIKENYYAHNKFHFHLSDTQVYKLLYLFNSQRSCNRGCKFISDSRHPRKNVDKKHQKFRSGKYEPNTESNTDLNVCPDLPGTNLDQFMYHKRPLRNADNAIVGIEATLHPTVSLLDQPEFPEIVNSTSQGVHAFGGNVPVGHENNSFYQLAPSLNLKNSSISSGMDNASVKDPDSYSGGSLDSHPFSRCQCYHPHPDHDILTTSSVYQNLGVSSNPPDASYPLYKSNCSLPALTSKDIRERVGISNLQDSITMNFQNRVSVTNLQNSNHPSSRGFNDHYTPDISSSNQRNYAKLHMDVTTSVHSPAKPELLGYGHCAATSQSDDTSRGPRYFRLEPHEIIPYSEYEPNNLEMIESSFCSCPEKASSRMPYGNGPSGYQGKDSSSCHLNQDDEYYPVALNSKFRSENHERRTSVFLRLSGIQKAPAEKVETYNSTMNVSFEELARDLSSRRKYWSKLTELPTFKKPTKVLDFKKMKLDPALKNVNGVSDHFVMLDDDETLENVDQLESHAAVLCDREQSCSVEGTENGTILPFLNFKRRSEVQRLACETETNKSVELRDSEVSLVKRKRRKLLRPSFGEEAASSKVDENVQVAIQALFLKANDGETNESVDTAGGIGNETHAGTGGSCRAGGVSQEHLIEKVQVTVSEHVGNVRSSPATQSDVAKQTGLNSEGVISIKGKSKFQNMQELSQDFHGGPLLAVDGNNSKGDECDADGGKEVKNINFSLSPHSDNAQTGTTDIASGEQCEIPNVQSPSEHFHEGLSFVKIGDRRGGVEDGDASHMNANGDERRQEAEYSGECGSCSCNLEGLFKSDVCRTAASAAQDIGTGELSSNQNLSHDEAAEKNQEENISARVHFTEFDCKNTENSQRNLVSMAYTREGNLSMKVHFTEFGGEITSCSQSILFRAAVEAGQPSSSTCIPHSAEAPRETKEEIGAERNPGIDVNYRKVSHRCPASSTEGIETAGLLSNPCTVHTKEPAAGMTAKLCRKRPLYEVVDNEMGTSHQRQLCTAEYMGTGGSLSEPCAVQTGKPTSNTEDGVISGRLLPKAADKDKRTSSCNPVRAAEFGSGETLSNTVVASCEVAESFQQGQSEDGTPCNIRQKLHQDITLKP